MPSDTPTTSWRCHDCGENFDFPQGQEGFNELARMQYRHDNSLYPTPAQEVPNV